MAKTINFVFGSDRWVAGIDKVERDKVYGWVNETVTDEKGGTCVLANMLDDGATIILSGGTALKTVSATTGAEVDKKSLKAVDAEGHDSMLLPAVFDADVALQKAVMDDLFNLEVLSAYQLVFEDDLVKQTLMNVLSNGALFRFPFSYRADYEHNDAIMLTGQNEVFVLVGRLLSFPWLENALVPVITDTDVSENEDDMDFGML